MVAYTNVKERRSARNILMINRKFFAILLMLTPLYLFTNPVLQALGYGSILFIFVLCIFDLFGRFNSIKVSRIWNWFFAYCAYSVLTLLREPTMGAIYSFLLQNILLLFMCMLSSINWSVDMIQCVKRAGKALCIVLFLPAFAVAIVGTRAGFAMFDSYFSPVLYKLILPCSYFLIADSKHKPSWVLFLALLFLRMVERTSAGVILIIYAVYLLLGVRLKTRFIRKAFFFVVFLGVLSTIFLYVGLQYHRLGVALNEIFRHFTGGNFFSGRNRLWEIALTHIKDSPFLGGGFSNKILQLYGINVSLHNTYLHVVLQGGVLGLVFFYGFLSSIWRELINSLHLNKVRLIASYFIGMLVFINFEVTMVGNTVTTAIYFWIILAIGLAESKNNYPENEFRE